MKPLKIAILVVVVLYLTLSSVSGKPTTNLADTTHENILCQLLPDSLYSMVKNRTAILYSYGHYGYSWSLITRIDGSYRAFSGRVSYSGDRHFTESTEANRIDSTQLFSKNKALLSWGFDTISTEINLMKKIRREHYVTFYTNLSVINSDGIDVFNSEDAIAFSGPDSLRFNKKIHKLCLIMRWLSDPEIRQYIPDSAIY